MIKIVRAHDLKDDSHVFSIIAWDKSFTYVFPKNRAPFNPFAKVKQLNSMLKPGLKPTVDDYLEIAKTGMSHFRYSKPMEDNVTYKIGVKSEQAILDRAFHDAMANQVNQRLIDTNEDMEQVLSDYPELYDQLADGTVDITADGMFELVMAALGSIDPEGPNKWLLDYMDGKELPEGEIPQIVFDMTTPKETGK